MALMDRVTDLPYPLNRPDEEKFAALRAMTPAERLKLAMDLSDQYRRRWMQELRAKHATATDAGFRKIVIAKLLAESEEERRCDDRCRKRTNDGAP